jgi:hypothetical protein
VTKIPFPISIGMVGAPGSGKRQVGEAFQELAAPYFEQNDSELWLLDNAGQTIQDDFDYAMGVFGTPADDLRAYFRRYEAEQMAQAKGVSYLTLGTAVDHIAHTGINLETIMTGLSTPDQEVKTQQGQLVMTVLTMLMQQHFRYTFGFYVPHPGTSIILPGEPDTENEYNQRIDRGIQMVFMNFNMRIQVLDQPTPEEKAQEMFTTIQRIMENGPELPKQEDSEELETEEEGAIPSTSEDTVPSEV